MSLKNLTEKPSCLKSLPAESLSIKSPAGIVSPTEKKTPISLATKGDHETSDSKKSGNEESTCESIFSEIFDREKLQSKNLAAKIYTVSKFIC